MQKLKEQIIAQGKWLRLKKTLFRNSKGQIVTWESIERLQQKMIIIILPRMVPSGRIVLIRQYRQALDSTVLGLPAGTLECDPADDQTVIQEALRELKEETGYHGIPLDLSPPLRSNSGIIDELTRILQVKIIESSAVNNNPVQQLEAAEEISVHLIPEQKVKEYLVQQQKLGIEIGAGLWYIFGMDKPLTADK
ncbi:MAG: NUDIX hydrolase [Candidatus Cloacimonetes bacterium]|nr:NUDIX hydrolase [Candidatus Cloacimonadota bacterium]